MANAYLDNRYIRVGRHGQDYFLVKNASDKLFLEIDMTDFIAAGRPNASLLTASATVVTDAGANAPTMTAGTHTASVVKYALAAGSATLWNSGAAGGYAIGQGAIKVVITVPDTSEVKEVNLVVSLVNISDPLGAAGGVGNADWVRTTKRIVQVVGNLQKGVHYLEPGETRLIRLDFAGWLGDRLGATNLSVGAITHAAWTGSAAGAANPTVAKVTSSETPSTVDFTMVAAANIALGTGNAGYRGHFAVTVTLNGGQATEEIRVVQVPEATCLTV